jgi:hypothetical protein
MVLFAVYLWRTSIVETLGIRRTLLVNVVAGVPSTAWFRRLVPLCVSGLPECPPGSDPARHCSHRREQLRALRHFATALLVFWFARPWRDFSSQRWTCR